MSDRPLYIFAKPPLDVVARIDRTRREHGFNTRYGPERFHITLARFGKSSAIAPAKITRIDDVVAWLSIEPFTVTFDRIHRSALVGTHGLPHVIAVQRALARHLGRCNVPTLTSTAQPHLSLAYNVPIRPDVTIAPITWRIDQLMLIVSHHGEARHEVLRRWSLTARQFTLPFAA